MRRQRTRNRRTQPSLAPPSSKDKFDLLKNETSSSTPLTLPVAPDPLSMVPRSYEGFADTMVLPPSPHATEQLPRTQNATQPDIIKYDFGDSDSDKAVPIHSRFQILPETGFDPVEFSRLLLGHSGVQVDRDENDHEANDTRDFYTWDDRLVLNQERTGELSMGAFQYEATSLFNDH